MARLEANLEIKTGQDRDYLCQLTKEYKDILTVQQIVDNGDEFTQIATFGLTESITSEVGGKFQGSKLVLIKNNSDISIEILIRCTDWKDNSNTDAQNSVDLGPDSATPHRQISYILAANEYMILPSTWMVSYAEAHSAANAKTLDNISGFDVNAGAMFKTSGATLAEAVDGSETEIDVSDGRYFEAGDLIQLGSTTGTTATLAEIMEITSKSSDTLTVKRAQYGSPAGNSSAQTTGHASAATIYFPFFNTLYDYDKFHNAATMKGRITTDANGRYKSQTPLLGYGRTSDGVSAGIVKGSLAIKFANNGYQAFGMTGITPSTHSGLTASTAYYFTIAIDGGSTYEVSFTTDASNLNFGGNNGIVSKIQAVLDSQFYVEGNLYEKAATVAIVNGDVRITSNNKTRTSAIALTAGTSGSSNTTNLFDGTNPIARIPASPSTAVDGEYPDDTIKDKTYNFSKSNKAVFAYDDGNGNIIGAASGTINYGTGHIDLTGPVNAEFAVSFNYDSAHSGGLTTGNTIKSINARSLNSKIDAEVELIGFV